MWAYLDIHVDLILKIFDKNGLKIHLNIEKVVFIKNRNTDKFWKS